MDPPPALGLAPAPSTPAQGSGLQGLVGGGCAPTSRHVLLKRIQLLLYFSGWDPR